MNDEARNGENGEHHKKITDRDLLPAFANAVHTESIEGIEGIQQNWRMKERMKTVSVALVICLNVGVDPPDIVKTQPCARLECWIDPLSMSPSKALTNIGLNLQKQYERWQPRARYKQSTDPTSEDIKKLCTSLRRNAKEERVLFHYNGHGVPRPTSNGEIWVFNKLYTQYIPLSIYDLQKWMGAPSIYVYDCSNAGIIVESFKQFAAQHDAEVEKRGTTPAPPSYKNCIQLAACSSTQILPMNPDLPGDLFTSCLTTPIKVALRWYALQPTSNLVPKINVELLDKMPGQITDRRTMLGELNWIFTAITDTIAWNTLPRDLFQKLFRQDLLVASLFRNFLLAERIMRSYDCTPISDPPLPPTYQHPMWQAWDLALDLSLGQLPNILEKNEPFVHLPFFEEQLKAFEVWLKLGSEKRSPPEQLPIVLQVLLSQVHRVKALELLGKFLDLGPWAVDLALSVGIFPYVLKLLQSSARELRPLLVFIWAKILAVDDSCQGDLVRDNGHRYFVTVLQDLSIPSESRTQAAFVLACIVNKNPDGQEVTVRSNVLSICLEQLSDPNPKLRQWLAICLGRLWDNFEKARWTGVRDTAHEKLYTLLQDTCPEVRAAAVYALGTFINSVANRTEHANNIDHGVIMTLVNTVGSDMSSLVRKELVVTIQWVILAFENTFITVASQELALQGPREHTAAPVIKRAGSRDHLKVAHVGIDVVDCPNDGMKRVRSTSSISLVGNLPGLSFGSIYMKLWTRLCTLESDPDPEVAKMATTVTSYIRSQVQRLSQPRDSGDGKFVSSMSLPPSPNRPSYLADSPPTLHTDMNKYGRSTLPLQGRRFNPNTISEREVKDFTKRVLVWTQFVAWSCKQFAQPSTKNADIDDVESRLHYEKEWRFIRNDAIRKEAQDDIKRCSTLKIENQIFNVKCGGPCPPSLLKFHPYDQHVAAVISDSVMMWDWGTSARLSHINYRASKNANTYITAIEWVNAFDVTLTMVAFNDGCVRIWKPSTKNKEPTLIGAWQALSDLSSSKKLGTSKLLMTWEQWTQTVITGGDSKVLRVWDAQKEMHAYDIPTGSECPVTCLDSAYSSVGHEREITEVSPDVDTDENGITMGPRSADLAGVDDTSRRQRRLVVAGCSNGAVRLFDRRCPPNEAKVKKWIEHDSSILGVQLRDDTVIAGGTKGEVRIFDIRGNNDPIRVNHALAGQSATAFAFHRTADMYACAYGQSIAQFTMQGTPINTMRFSEGFISYRTGALVLSLAYHPYKMVLAAATVDTSLYAYVPDCRQR